MPDSQAKFTTRLVGPTTVILLRGPHISDQVYVDHLGEDLIEVLETAASPDLLIDFSEIDFLTSSLLGRLIRVHKRAREAGGRLRLCSIRPRILEIFEITQLDRIMDIHPSADDALGPQP